MEGVVISIKKRMLNALNLGYCEQSFFVWGFYDVLDIFPVERWSDFMRSTPFSAWNMDSFTNEMQIKLICPENINALKELPCTDYSQRLDIEQILNKPLLSVILVNFMDDRTRGFNLNDKIEELTKRLSCEFDAFENSKKPSFAIYTTIGFMDAVILCRSNSFSAVVDALVKFRSENCLLLSSYMLPCIYANADNYDSWANNEDDYSTKLSVRSTLKSDVSYECFQWEFQQELADLGYPNECRFYKLFGNYDTLATPEIPASRLYNMYFKNGDKLLQPPYKNMLTLTKGSIKVESDPLEEAPVFDPPKPWDIREAQQQFIKHISECFSNKSSDIVSDSVKNSLLYLANFYFDITSSSHTFDVRAMMDPYLDAFVRCFKLLDMPNFHDRLTVGEFNKSINILIDEFTYLISEFARADRHMFEGRWIKNPSVSSASKLLMTYHFYLNQVVNIFAGQSTYTFVTTSNNVHSTQADSIFNFFTPDSKTKEEHLFVILRIPERRLYNISHTLFNIMHEVFHFLGNRERDLRNTNMILSFSLFYVQSFISSYWKEHSGVVTGLVSCLKEKEDQDFLYNVIKNYRMKIEKDLFLIYYESLTEYIDNHPPRSIYLRYWKEVLHNGLDELCDKIYNILIPMHKDILCHALNTLCQLKSGKKPNNRIMIDYQKLSVGLEHKPLIDSHMDAVNRHWDTIHGISVNSFTITIKEAYESLMEACGETYSDMCAVILLGSSLLDYLSNFYSPNFEEILPKNTRSAFRIYCVIEVCYPDQKISMPMSSEFEKYIHLLLNLVRGCETLVSQLIVYLKSCKARLESDLEPHRESLAGLRKLYKSAKPDSIIDIPDIDEDVVWQIFDKWNTMA